MITTSVLRNINFENSLLPELCNVLVDGNEESSSASSDCSYHEKGRDLRETVVAILKDEDFRTLMRVSNNSTSKNS